MTALYWSAVEPPGREPRVSVVRHSEVEMALDPRLAPPFIHTAPLQARQAQTNMTFDLAGLRSWIAWVTLRDPIPDGSVALPRFTPFSVSKPDAKMVSPNVGQ